MLDTIRDKTQTVQKGRDKDSYDGCRETSGVGRGGPGVAEREIDAKRVHKIRLWSGRAVGKSLESMNREDGDLDWVCLMSGQEDWTGKELRKLTARAVRAAEEGGGQTGHVQSCRFGRL